ncbi:CHAT domain-containing protein [Suillus ampliporus]|nr:CHAT domain-containing protein [Suillus ampliporus]
MPFIRLEVISGKTLKVPSERIPAGIYVSINVDVGIGHPSPTIRRVLEIRASFELGRMLGNRELIGKLETSWDDLVDHGNEPFDLSFPLVRGVYLSLTLKAASSIVECHIARRTDAGHARLAKYVTSNRVSDLNNAVKHFQSVLDQRPVGHPHHIAAITNLAWARLQGYIRKDLQDIDSTTSLFRDALALHPQNHPEHPLSVYCLTEALDWRYHYQHTTADISESAQLYHDLLPLCADGTYLRSIAVGENGVDNVIGECNELPADTSSEGIRLRRTVLELCPLGHQHRPRALNQLSWTLTIHFRQSGSIDDIDESIQLGREAVALCPEGGALRTRFSQRRDIDDINKAISWGREALALRPPGHQHRDTTLNNLAIALQERYYTDLHASDSDLNEAIDLHREALRLKQHDDPERHTNLLNLSSALRSRFMQTLADEDVEEAIDLCQQSLAALPPLHPDRHHSYCMLREAYRSRYRVQDEPEDLSLAMENFSLASKHPTQGFPARILEAYNWTFAAEVYSHVSALEVYATFFELFDAHLSTRSSIISRREAAVAFHYAKTLPVDAASCALRGHNIQKAVELVEQGRGQQWSLASRLRTPLEDLESANPQLARNFSELSKRVSDAAQGSAAITNRAAADLAATEYRKLTEQWDASVVEIHNNNGFSRFLLPPSYTDLQAAACQGPVIILIASQYSYNAVIVPTSGDPHHVPFPSLALADLETLKVNFAKAIRHASLMGPTETRTDLIVLLRKIWDEIMLPVVKVLWQDLKVKPRSRIWLCPTAAFTSIPLHAAHPSRMKGDGQGRELCLEDIYICSYTPTLSALIRARQTMKMRVIPSFAAIGQSQPGAGQGTMLATVDSELELVHKLVPPNVKFTSLSGEEATQAGALDALRHNTWVHLACHGKQDREQPYNSRFAMRDKPLTLLDIMENNAPQAEFAFLSACHTAVGDEETPDEVIYLAAGLQFSGFKGVIGTLWVVDDDVAQHVVEAFYEDMFKDLKEGTIIDCTKAASALNKATYAVTKKVPLEQRIVFIHIGV